MKKPIYPRRHRYLWPIYIGLALVILAASYYFFVYRHPAKPAVVSPGLSSADLSPATPAEQQDSNSHKTDQTKPTDTTQTNETSTRLIAYPAIVDAGQYGQAVEVKSFITSIYESGGVCTVTLTHESLKVVRTGESVMDASTLRCPPVSIPRAEFAATGEWSALVSYSSAKYSGDSSAVKFEVR